MTDTATFRQKQFLRQLGYKDSAKLTKQQASQLIDKLLADEKASGKTFPCPYCKAKFGPRPKREKKCPSCGKTIIQLSGRFYTQEQADRHYQSVWLKESRQDTKEEVSNDWKEEKRYRKEFGEPLIVGYQVTAGPDCPHTKRVEPWLFLIEDAYDVPDILPPFDECRHDECECEFSPVLADEVEPSRQVAEWGDPAIQAKLKTRKSAIGIKNQKLPTKSSGCLSVVLLGVSLVMLLVMSVV